MAITGLQQLGFSEYEARAYVSLLQHGPLNGYELAKASSLPRANVYGVLRKLEEEGVVVRADSSAGVRYSAVPYEEVVERLRRRFLGALDDAKRSLSEIHSRVEPDYAWNAQGYRALLEHARSVVDGTQGRLLVATWPQEARALASNLARASLAGVQVTTLCLAACPTECGGCQGTIYRFRVAPQNDNHWLVLVPDGAEVLVGEVSPGDDAMAMRSRQRLLVELASWYIRHSIALAVVVDDLGDRLKDLLGPEARAALAVVGPEQDNGWLEHMRDLLSTKPVSEEN